MFAKYRKRESIFWSKPIILYFDFFLYRLSFLNLYSTEINYKIYYLINIDSNF